MYSWPKSPCGNHKHSPKTASEHPHQTVQARIDPDPLTSGVQDTGPEQFLRPNGTAPGISLAEDSSGVEELFPRPFPCAASQFLPFKSESRTYKVNFSIRDIRQFLDNLLEAVYPAVQIECSKVILQPPSFQNAADHYFP